MPLKCSSRDGKGKGKKVRFITVFFDFTADANPKKLVESHQHESASTEPR